MGSVTSIPKSQPMKSITRKTAIFSRRTTEVPQLKVWVRINVALLTLRPQITQGEVSPSGRLLTTLRRCVTGELECYCSHGCHRNTCFLQLTAPRCHPHRNSSDQKSGYPWLSSAVWTGCWWLYPVCMTSDSWWHVAPLQMLTGEHSCSQVTASSQQCIHMELQRQLPLYPL